MSGQSLDRLASPSGPEDASLGLVMHIQKKDRPIGDFWEAKSRAIQVLGQKGLERDSSIASVI